MSASFRSDTAAGEFAKRVYEASEMCYMAHSIRAVEHYLRINYRFDTPIRLVFSASVRSDMNRMSWCSVAENSGDTSYIYIQDDPEWDHNRCRFCIAHELYHILWSAASPENVTRDPAAESICDLFANDLCRRHDEFYDFQRHPENQQKLRFQGLPYRSV